MLAEKHGNRITMDRTIPDRFSNPAVLTWVLFSGIFWDVSSLYWNRRKESIWIHLLLGHVIRKCWIMKKFMYSQGSLMHAKMRVRHRIYQYWQKGGQEEKLQRELQWACYPIFPVCFICHATPWPKWMGQK